MGRVTSGYIRWVGVFAAMIAAIIPAKACLWDTDTLKQERSRFPTVLELITGKFPRHTPEFHQWRIADRQAELEKNPADVRLYDDLAVSYDKLGDHRQAIECMLISKKLRPDRYETIANLGTFYIHSGDLSQGIRYIRTALAVNPDAHFGREKYQALLAEYVYSRPSDRVGKRPLAVFDFKSRRVVDLPSGESIPIVFDDFSAFLLPQPGDSPNSGKEPFDRRAAVKGIAGMMRFGKHDSPVLLEALGSVLADFAEIPVQPEQDGRRLAARAFLKASYEIKDAESAKNYRLMAARALWGQRHPEGRFIVTLHEVEQTFHKELEEANRWYDGLRQDELRWIQEGKNPEAEFDRKYFKIEPLEDHTPPPPDEWAPVRNRSAVVFPVCLVVAWFYLRWRRRQEIRSKENAG